MFQEFLDKWFKELLSPCFQGKTNLPGIKVLELDITELTFFEKG
jgi:hypothetical protein